jgi:YebC/PmpR family DNA-binding regulatory protein
MSGHNKWSKIKHKKGAADAHKSREFGKIVRLLSVESKKAGGDRTAAGLSTAIDKARTVNMPKDTIDRAITKGQSSDTVAADSVTYESYGPGGAAIIIEALSENRNKTSAEVKHALAKKGCALAASGAASWAFTRESNGEWKPSTTTDISESDAEKLAALVEDILELDDTQEVYTNAA